MSKLPDHVQSFTVRQLLIRGELAALRVVLHFTGKAWFQLEPWPNDLYLLTIKPEWVRTPDLVHLGLRCRYSRAKGTDWEGFNGDDVLIRFDTAEMFLNIEVLHVPPT